MRTATRTPRGRWCSNAPLPLQRHAAARAGAGGAGPRARRGPRQPAADHDLRGPDRADRRQHARPDAGRDPRLRRDPHPPARLLELLRAEPERQAQAAGRPQQPGQLPGGHVGPARRAVRGRPGARHQGAADADRPGAEVGDQHEEGPPDPAEPQVLRPVRARGRRTLRRRHRHVVDLERAQPAAVPAAPVPQAHAGLAGIYRRLYQAAGKVLRSQPANPRDIVLVGETSPRGNRHVVHPLTFVQRMLCLNSSYHRTRKCAKLDTNGYAHHAYTTRTGPRFVPPKGDVTIGVLSRLNDALDKAARAGMIPRRLKIYLTEFGIQTTPDEISGVSFAKQSA